MRAFAKKAWAPLAVFILVMSLTAAQPAFRPAPAQAAPMLLGIPNPCDLLPNDIARQACKVGTDPIGAIGSAIGQIPGVPNPLDIPGQVAGEVAQSIFQPFLYQVARAEAASVDWLLQEEAKAINNTTTPNLLADWFKPQYEMGFGFAVLIGLVLLIARIIMAVKNTDINDMGKGFAAFITLVLVGGGLPPLVATLVEVSQGVLAPGWMETAGSSANSILTSVGGGITQNTSTINDVGLIVVAAILLLVAVIFGILSWLILVMSAALTFVFTIWAVLAMAPWIGGRLGGDRSIRVFLSLFGVINIKLVAAIALTVGIGVFNSGIQDSSITAVLMGTAIMIMIPAIVFGFYRWVTNHQFTVRQATSPVQKIYTTVVTSSRFRSAPTVA